MEGRAVNPLQISEWGHTNFNDQNCSLRHDLGPGPGPQILAEMGFLEGGARRRREKFGIWGP